MKLFLLINLLFIIEAHAQVCPITSTNSKFIVITENQSDLKTYSDLDVKTFNDVSNPHNTKLVMGFTLGSISLKSDYKIRYQKIKDKYCAWIENINITYSLDKLDVYIPNDLKPGTCKHKEVEKHELEHVAIYKETYRNYLAKLKNITNHKNTNLKPENSILVNDVKDAEEIFKIDIENYLNSFQSELTKSLNKKHKAIDTEENYQKIASRCKGWGNIN